MTTPLTVVLQGDTKDLDAALDKTSGGMDLFGQKISGGMLLAGGAVVAGAGLAIGAIADWTSAAAADRDEQEKLMTAYQNAGAAMGDYTASIDAAIVKGGELAFSDSEVRAALEPLVTTTGDADEANDLLAKSMDIARAAGVPLSQAADAVAKAHEGQDSALRKLFPGMGKQATAADTITEATRLSEDAANDYATSAEGMGKKGGQAFDELTETIGATFLPIMDELLPALTPIIEELGKLIKDLLPLLKPVIDIAVGAIKIFLGVLRTVITILGNVIDVVKGVIDWIGRMVDIAANAVSTVQGAIDAVNPFAVSGTPGAPSMAEFGAQAFAAPRAGGGGGGGANVTVNVMSADPEQVVRAIRRWTRANGGSAPFTRGLDRSTA